MAQTTGAKTMRDVAIDWSTNSSVWNNIDGTTNSVTPSGGDRMMGEVYTADGDTAILGAGKREPIDVEINIVYSEVTTESFLKLEPIYTAGTPIRIRYAPAGGATGDYRYTSATGYISSFAYPGGEVETGDPIVCSMTVRTPALVPAAIS